MAATHSEKKKLRPMNEEQLSHTFEQLSMLLGAGIPPAEALDIMLRDKDNKELSGAYQILLDQLMKGASLNEAAKESGLVSGDENGNFNPDANITNEEFVKMAVCVVGYTPYADVNGGYPMGYVSAAARFGLTTDLQLEPQTAAKREDVAIITANALDIPLMVKKGDMENEEWVIMDGNGEYEKQTLRTRLDGANK